MKLKTSFFNGCVLRKDLTRFAALWVLYTIGLLLFHIIAAGGYHDPLYFGMQIAAETSGMAPVVCGYAFLCAMVLFSDLFVPRMCNALHAMPMRREGWFLTHAAAGLLFGLIPHLLAALVFLFQLGEYRYLAGYWLGSVLLQYVFFFGAGCFSALCAGTRLGMAAVYAILNFAMTFVYVLVDALYLPLLPGVVLTAEPFEAFWPLYRVLGHPPVEARAVKEQLQVEIAGGAWGYLFVLAAVGILLAGLAVLLYRRRHLERAGDFLAFKPLAPVFLLIATLGAGLFLYLFADLFFNMPRRLFLYAGMAIGYFVGLMLLRRNSRVFQPRAIAAFVILCALLAGSLAVTKLDPMGIVTRVPSEDRIVSCSMDFSYQSSTTAITDPMKIHQIVEAHEQLCRMPEVENDRPYEQGVTPVRIRYELTNGTTMHRVYTVDNATEAGKLVADILYSWQNLLGCEDLEAFAKTITSLSVTLYENLEGVQYADAAPADYLPLLEAFAADADAGFLRPVHTRNDTEPIRGHLDFEMYTEEGNWDYRSFEIPESAVKTVAAIRQLIAKQ